MDGTAANNETIYESNQVMPLTILLHSAYDENAFCTSVIHTPILMSRQSGRILFESYLISSQELSNLIQLTLAHNHF